ncbi:hypothetical protein AAE478_001751 [Parahypoxylon ruwenzoriense]
MVVLSLSHKEISVNLPRRESGTEEFRWRMQRWDGPQTVYQTMDIAIVLTLREEHSEQVSRRDSRKVRGTHTRVINQSVPVYVNASTNVVLVEQIITALSAPSDQTVDCEPGYHNSVPVDHDQL